MKLSLDVQFVLSFFFFNDPAPTEISPLPHPAALPTSRPRAPPSHPMSRPARASCRTGGATGRTQSAPWTSPCRTHRNSSSRRSARPPLSALRSEEHTSELQSRLHLVCRLLLEKKNNRP